MKEQGKRTIIKRRKDSTMIVTKVKMKAEEEERKYLGLTEYFQREPKTRIKR